MSLPFPARLRAVLFDWDGTLVDSAGLSFDCYVTVFTRFGVPFDRDDYARTYSPDWYSTYRLLGLDEACWPEADRLWREHYAGTGAHLLPGAQAALERLAGAGLALGIVSSGERERVDREHRTLGLGAFFETLVCGGDTERRKPHPQPLEAALERMRTAPGEAVYVGDSPEDIQMAHAAGVYAVGIPGGFPNQDALRRSGPELFARDIEDAAGRLLSAAGTKAASRS
ncbi:MAG: HAD family hydrolase [Vicinamibacteria bacterium]